MARATLPAALAVALLLAGCLGPRWHRETFHQSGDFEVLLRSQEGVHPGYDHPVTISAIRMTHILASLDVRHDGDEKKGARSPAVPVEIVFALGELAADALVEADADQHVVVMAERTERNLKIFTEKRLTSFVAYVKDDRLHLHLSHLDWPVPKNPNARLREPVPGKRVMDFKVLGAPSVLPTGPQSVAVAWRDDTVRRALADLEEARRAGQVSEAEYRARREDILERAAR